MQIIVYNLECCVCGFKQTYHVSLFTVIDQEISMPDKKAIT